jgi:hypothetical protein
MDLPHVVMVHTCQFFDIALTSALGGWVSPEEATGSYGCDGKMTHFLYGLIDDNAKR